MVEWVLEKLGWHILLVRGNGNVSIWGTPWGWLGVLQEWGKFSMFVNETIYRHVKNKLVLSTWMDDEDKKSLLFKLEGTRHVTQN